MIKMKRTRRTTPLCADEVKSEVSSPDIKLRRVDETGQELMVEAGNEDNVEMDAQQPQQDVVVDEGLPAELSETPGDMQVVEQEMVVQEQEVLIAPDEVIVGDSEDTYIQEEVVGEQPQQQQQLLVQQQQPQADACSIQQQIEQQIRVETQNQMQLSGHNGIPSQQHRQQQQHRLQQHHQPQQQHIGNIDLVAIAANAEHIPVNTPTMPIKRGRGRPRKSMVSTPQVQRTPMKALISPVIGPDGTIRRSVGRPRKDPNSEYISMASPLVTDGASARRERQMKAKKVFEDYEENYVPGKKGKDESSDDDDYEVPPPPKPRNLVRDMQEAGIESLCVDLPVPNLLVSLNTSQQPEIRTLYIFQNTPKNGWLKIICKRLLNTQYYQCPMCPFVDPVPREVADHLNNKHHHMMNIAEGKCTRIFSTFLFMFCRHCDFIAYEKLALWYHYEHHHNLKDMIGSKPIDPASINMSSFPVLPQSALLNAKMILRCTECPFLCLSKKHALLHAQKEHCGSTKSHGNGFVAMTQLNERNKPQGVDALMSSGNTEILNKPQTTTVNIPSVDGLEEGIIETSSERTMTLKDIFICSECLFITYKRPLMEVHCVNNHARRVLLLVCSMCDAQFDTIYKMSAHIGETHDEIKRQFCSVTVIDQEGKEDIHLQTSKERKEAQENQASGVMQSMSLLKPGQLNNSQLAVTVTPNANKSQIKMLNSNFGDRPMPLDSQKFRYVKLPDGRVLQVPAEHAGSTQPRYIKLPDGTILKLPSPHDKQPFDLIKKAEPTKGVPLQLKNAGTPQAAPGTRYLKLPDGTLHQIPTGKNDPNKSQIRYLKLPDGTLRAISGNITNQMKPNPAGLQMQVRKPITQMPQLKKDARYLKLPDGSLHEIPPLAEGAKSETRYLKLPDGSLHRIPPEFNAPPKPVAPKKPTKFLKMPGGEIKPLNDDGSPAVTPLNTKYIQMPDGSIHQINCTTSEAVVEKPPPTIDAAPKTILDQLANGDVNPNTRFLQMPDGSIQQITTDLPMDKDTRYVQMPDGSIQALNADHPLANQSVAENSNDNQSDVSMQHTMQPHQIADTTTSTASSGDLAMQSQQPSQERFLQLPDGSIHPLPEGMDANDPNLKFVQLSDGSIQQVPIDQEDFEDSSQQRQEDPEVDEMLQEPEADAPENPNGLSDEHRQQLISQGIDPNIVQSYIQLPDGTLQPINPEEEDQLQNINGDEDNQTVPVDDQQDQQEQVENPVEQMFSSDNQPPDDQTQHPEQELLDDRQQIEGELDTNQMSNEQLLQEQQQQGEINETDQQFEAEEPEYINLEAGPDADSRYIRLSDGTLLQIPNMPENDQIQYVRLPDNRVLQLPPNGSLDPAIVIKEPVVQQYEEPNSEVQQEGEEMVQQEGQEMVQQEGQEMIQQEGQEMIQQEGQEMIQQEGQEMIQQEGQEMIQQEGQEMIQQDGHEMIQQEEQEMIHQEGHEMIQQEGQEMIQQEGQEMIQQEGQEIIQQEGQEMIKQEDQEMIQQEGQEMIQQEGQEMIKQEGQEMIQQEGQEMIQQEGHEVIKQEGQEMILHDGQEIIQQEAQEIIEEDGQEIIKQEGQEIIQEECEQMVQYEGDQTQQTDMLPEQEEMQTQHDIQVRENIEEALLHESDDHMADEEENIGVSNTENEND